ncbi:C40 family peptidase [Streptomyces sp. NBC_01304]|uniref:C40 family peptidase n=1 Tax=Streptomyces sp. NBC_01304 TaxID=2903818 RepID=UPI002E15A7E1|nr:C40 family peptidase [Streptomyces sp. NBC_01304]
MRKVGLVIATVTAGGVFAAYSLMSAVTAPLQGLDLEGVACAALDYKLGKLFNISAEQKANAEVIIEVGSAMGISPKGQVVAIATAMQESGLRNINYGDRDSIGLFQQRPSQGWGSQAQIMNPRYSASKFYNSLVKVNNWQNMAVTDAAQAVQRSGFPDAYAKHEATASQIVTSAYASKSGGGGGGGVQQINASSGCIPQPNPASYKTRGYVSKAMSQVGKPYVWGGTGPNGFDCSGLIVWAWRQEGYQLKVRTSQQMYDAAVPVRRGQEKPGDLIFTEFEAGGPAHVMIVVERGLALEAPRTGLDVRTRAYNPDTENMRFGRLPQSQMTAATAQA